MFWLSLYISQISPGALFSQGLSAFFCVNFRVGPRFVCIKAVQPGAIPFSWRSGRRNTCNIFPWESPYWRIFILECSVQKIFLYTAMVFIYFTIITLNYEMLSW